MIHYQVTNPNSSYGVLQHGYAESWVQPRLAGVLESYNSIGLDELGAASLMNRVDTKYVFHVGELESLLTSLQNDYRVLKVAGTQNPYCSLYFDTPDFALFRQHHAGARGRYKLRSRSYEDTNTQFFEVKYKDNKGKTSKQRVPTSELVTDVSAVDDFLAQVFPFEAAAFEPKLESTYLRTTLVSLTGDERVTLDTGLTFGAKDRQVNLPSLVIAEVKRERLAAASPFGQHMKARRIFPGSLSKYCLGVSQLYPEVKHNRFKPVLRKLSGITAIEEMAHA